MFVDISIVAEEPPDLFGVAIPGLETLLFTKSDGHSHNAGNAKGRTFLTDLIVNLVTFFPEIGKTFCFLVYLHDNILFKCLC